MSEDVFTQEARERREAHLARLAKIAAGSYSPHSAPQVEDADAANEVPPPIHFEPRTSPIPTVEECYPALSAAYLDYEAKLGNLSLEENRLAAAKITLEVERGAILAHTDPKYLGANEDQRKAVMGLRLSAEIHEVQQRTSSVELLRSEVEMARVRARLQDMTLRCIEVSMMASTLYVTEADRL